MGKKHLIIIAIIIHWPTVANPGQVSSPLTFQATSTMELLKPYKGLMHLFLAYKTTGHTKPCAWYHVLDQNHWTNSRIKINPYKIDEIMGWKIENQCVQCRCVSVICENAKCAISFARQLCHLLCRFLILLHIKYGRIVKGILTYPLHLDLTFRIVLIFLTSHVDTWKMFSLFLLL